MSSRPLLALSALLVALAPGCKPERAAKPPEHGAAASVSSGGRVHLAPEAEARLDIPAHLAAVERRERAERRVLRGQVLVVPGARASVTAPLAGTLVAATQDAPAPRAGERVARGQPLAWLQVLVPPAQALQQASAAADARTRLTQADSELETARTLLSRAEELLAKRAVAVRVVEEARVREAAARAGLDVARAQVAAIDSARAAAAAPLPLRAPCAGVLESVAATPGESVSAGTPIAVVVALDPLWVRVPLPTADLAELGEVREGQVLPLGGAGPPARAARVAQAPPTAAPSGDSVDLYLELPGASGLVPGQAAQVELALPPRAETVVPWAGVLHDAAGKAWVYEALGGGDYARRPVEVARVRDGLAVLASCPLAPGARVVTAGATELLGIEQGRK
ncbi:MAG: efflux RND transporter periplasmic adaptor subunit [Planctomycetota bacterium]